MARVPLAVDERELDDAFGHARVPSDAGDLREALRLADRRLDRQKAARRPPETPELAAALAPR